MKCRIVFAAALAATAPAAASAHAGPEHPRGAEGPAELVRRVDCAIAYDALRGAQACAAPTAAPERLAAQNGGAPKTGPRFERLSTGAGVVTFRDGCLVSYSRTGRRDGSEGCLPMQITRADKLVKANWRR